MDYGDILFKAYENKQESEKKDVRCYVTKLPPQQTARNSPVTKDNIKTFLAKKEEDELKKRKEQEDKKERLIALRKEDKQAMKRVKNMLNKTKSAIKSVLPDVECHLDLKQCDEDDYGFTSQESSEMYARIVNKYIKLPEADVPQRVKIQCKINIKAKKKGGYIDIDDDGKDKKENNKQEETVGKKVVGIDAGTNKPTSAKKQRPPPISYDDLLKIAKKKQLETVIIHKPMCKKSELLQKKGMKKNQKQSEKRTIKKKNIFILS